MHFLFGRDEEISEANLGDFSEEFSSTFLIDLSESFSERISESVSKRIHGVIFEGVHESISRVTFGITARRISTGVFERNWNIYEEILERAFGANYARSAFKIPGESVDDFLYGSLKKIKEYM